MGIEEIRAIKAGAKKKDTSSTPYKIPQKSAKKIASEKSEKEKRGDRETELQQWYANIMATEKPVCWETGDKINTDEKKVKNKPDGWHGSIAHILPKKIFPSVATHPLNYTILKMWGGTHAKYDLSWESASKMKVWPRVVERFLKIYPSIADNEKKYLPDVLLIHLKETE